MSDVRLTLNGKQASAPEGATVAALLARFGLAAAHVVVERNGEPLLRGDFDATAVAEGDVIEIAQMVGGG